MSPSKKGLVVSRGPVEVDIPRSVGYYGGIALAVGLGMIEWPIGIFIGAIPVLKMLTRDDLPRRVQFVGELFDGAAKPVGGDAEGTIRITSTPGRFRNLTAGRRPAKPSNGGSRAPRRTTTSTARRRANSTGARSRRRRATEGTGGTTESSASS